MEKRSRVRRFDYWRRVELLEGNPFARELLAGAYWKTGAFERVLAEDLRQAEALGLSGETLGVPPR